MRVDFYHLEKWTLEKALPLIMEKVYASSAHAVIKVGTQERADYLSTLLWTYDNNSWLPHGTEKDGNPLSQPIWITYGEDNPNNASILVLLDSENIDFSATAYERVLIMFDGNSQEALTAARNAWKEAKNSGAEMFYWQQDENGVFKAKDLR